MELPPDPFCGTKITVTRCVMEFAGWVRTHRKKRINKKWRKRYGSKKRCDMRDKLIRCGNIVMGCRCAMERLKQEVMTWNTTV